MRKLAEQNPDISTEGTASAEGTPKKTPVKRKSSTAAAKDKENSGEAVEGAADAAGADGENANGSAEGVAEGVAEPEAETPKKRQKRTPKKGIARKVVKKDNV